MIIEQIDRILEVESPDTLYHVTYLANVEDIASDGLKPGRGQVFGGGYVGHSSGRVFLTEWKGVRYWMNKYEQQADHLSDESLEDGLIPVVLRVDVSGIGLEVDDAGTRDSHADSFFAIDKIKSSRIEAYNGRSWKSVRSVDVERMMDEAEEAADVEEYDGMRIVWPDFMIFRPRKG